MDRQTLQRLAETGIETLPPDRLSDLIAWCWDQADNTGDSRYCGIARALTPIARDFDERDEYGGVPLAAVQAVDRILIDRLQHVLDEPEAGTAALLARSMREDVHAVWRRNLT